MMLGRGLLGKLVMVVFILFNVVMLGAAVLVYSLQNVPTEEIHADVLAKVIELGKETRDDSELDAEEQADIEQAVDEIMEVVLLVQQKGFAGVLVLWAIGAGILAVLLYCTRPQPI